VPASNKNGAGYKFIREFDLSGESQKKFNLQDLLPENSETLKVISEGLLEGKEFLLPIE